MTRFAMVQAPACREVGENLRALEAFARQAGAEAFLTGYFPEETDFLSRSHCKP